MQPRTSLRECCKQLSLLELHLAVIDARCPDCIGKHLLTAEAFADEAAQLGPDTRCAQLGRQVSATLYEMQGWWRQDPIAAAKAVRQLRKQLQPYVC